MARAFNGSNQYLEIMTPIVTINPLTFSCWIYLNAINTYQVAMCISRGTNPSLNDLFRVMVFNNNVIECSSFIGTTPTIAKTSNTVSINRWYHIAATFSTSNGQYAWLSGLKSSNGGNSQVPASLDRTSIGREYVINTQFFLFNGYICEAAIYNTVLDDSEIIALSTGYVPTMIKPQSLVAYYPLGGNHGQYDADFWKNRYDLTAYNSPTWTDHPRIIYQSGSRNNFTPFPDYTKLIDVIHPTNYYSIDSNYPSLIVRNNRESLSFSGTTQQTAYFSRIMPRTYTGNGCHVYLYVAASTDVASTQNANFSFDVAFERIGNRVQPIDTNNFSSNKNRYYEQVPEVCGYIKCIKIPFTATQMNNIQAGELYTLRVQRAVAFDDAVGNAELYAIEIRNP